MALVLAAEIIALMAMRSGEVWRLVGVTQVAVIISAVASAAFVVTLFLQWRQLTLQRKELKLARRLARRQAQAMEHQVETMVAQLNYMVSQDAPELQFTRHGIHPLPAHGEKVDYEVTNHGGVAQDIRIEWADENLQEFHVVEDTLDRGAQCDAWCVVRAFLEEDIHFVLSCKMGNGRPVRFDGSFRRISRWITLKRREIRWMAREAGDAGTAGDRIDDKQSE